MVRAGSIFLARFCDADLDGVGAQVEQAVEIPGAVSMHVARPMFCNRSCGQQTWLLVASSLLSTTSTIPCEGIMTMVDSWLLLWKISPASRLFGIKHFAGQVFYEADRQVTWLHVAWCFFPGR